MKYKEKHKEIIKSALLIRKTEERLLDLFNEGMLNGTVHTCVGQEFIGASLTKILRENDMLFSNHRGHGHFIGSTNNVEGLISEVMGKDSGAAGGFGGSQHLLSENFLSNGIQGGMVPVAAGYALINKLEKINSATIVFIGDGTLGEGILYEALNMISKWELPLLIVIENNSYAQSTKTSTVISGNIKNRALAFDIKYDEADTWNWEKLLSQFESSINYVRDNSSPVILEINTYRLNAHSKGDDNRSKREVEDHNSLDPLNIILDKNLDFITKEEKTIDNRLNNAVKKALFDNDCKYNPPKINQLKKVNWSLPSYDNPDIISNLIYLALSSQFKNSKKTIMIGEDIEGEYGGAFKVTKDLSIKFPNRVRNTPISEASITGIATGASINGYVSIIEIMFGDFLTLCFDQIINHATKFCEMYGKKLNIPLLIRVPMGGKRGYGPTHSQSIEKHFLGIPNLDVIALNHRVSPLIIYKNLFSNITNPKLVIENKILYTKKLEVLPLAGYEVLETDELLPTIKITPKSNTPSITLFCYGGILEEVEIAVEKIFIEKEIFCEIICPTLIDPINIQPLVESIAKTMKLLIVEEGPNVASLGAELISLIVEGQHMTELNVRRIGYNGLIPCAINTEKKITPNSHNIFKQINEMFK